MSHKATNWLADIPATEINGSEFRVLFHLCDCHNPSQGCFPTQSYLRERAGVSNGTLNNALAGLEKKGLIRRYREFDERTHKQKPTRYMLGFEIEQPQEPSPKTGDGKPRKPSPKSGDGAVSNLRPNPSPISTPSRLQPVGDVTSKEPVINPEALDGAAKFWAEKVRRKAFIPANAISSQVVGRILELNLLDPADLRAAGVDC